MDVLASELNRKQHLYNDDLAFIREVKQGVVAAPGMNPDQELKTLRLRFDAFKKDFKVSCWWMLQVCCCMHDQTTGARLGAALAVVVPAEARQPLCPHCWGEGTCPLGRGMSAGHSGLPPTRCLGTAGAIGRHREHSEKD